MTRRLRRRNDEKGATMVEFALIFGFLMAIALGTFEYGMLFRDWLSVSVSAREAGRVAASAANYGQADCVVLEAATGALKSLQSGRIAEVEIYKSDATGSYPGASSSVINRYRPAVAGDTTLIVCGSTSWVELHNGGSWEPDDRVNTGGSPDWIGVRLDFEHTWMTDFMWWSGTADFSDDVVFRMEPPAP